MNSIVITGATSGIGLEAVKHLASIAKNEQIIIACRNLKSGNEIANSIKQTTGHKHIICLPLYLNSLTSVRKFSALFADGKHGKISALLNNAGGQRVGPTAYTEDGVEETFGVNHLSPTYLTILLLPYLTADASITFTASGTHDPKQKTGMPKPNLESVELMAHPKPTDDTQLSVGQTRYTTSKLLNVLSTYELQRRLANTNIRVNAFDPGFVPGTGLARNYSPVLKWISKYVFKVLLLLPNVNTASVSGKRLAELAVSDKHKSAKGKYFEGAKEIPSSVDSYNQEYQKMLWQGSIKLLDIQPQETIISLA